MKQPQQLQKTDGKLAVLLPGLGAVATTFVAGCMLARKGLGEPVGSLTQMGTIRLGKRTDNRAPKIKDFAPLAELDQLVTYAREMGGDAAWVFAVEGPAYRFGAKPLRAEVLTQISGVTFDEAATDSLTTAVEGRPVRIIGREALLRNKRAAGRHKDLDDVEWLERFT